MVSEEKLKNVYFAINDVDIQSKAYRYGRYGYGYGKYGSYGYGYTQHKTKDDAKIGNT